MHPRAQRHAIRMGVVGAGRVGAVLAAAFREAGHEIVSVAGDSDASRTRAETLLPGVPLAKPTAVARTCDLLLLTVPDDALDNVVRMLVASGAVHDGHVVVHTSGLHGLSVLDPAIEAGARGIAMHPAMTFTGTGLDLERLAGCVFGVTCGPAEHALARQLVSDLGGILNLIDEAARPLYHAALAHGANHLVTLVSQSMTMLREAGSSDPACVLRPLLSAALDNALRYEDAALTGPIVRGDIETIRGHLEAIVESAPSSVASYVAMARATAQHAVLDGRLEPRRAAQLADVFDEAAAKVVP